jgi:hypothetical protein
MIYVATTLASLVLLVCGVLAVLCAYLMLAPNYNTEIRPKLISSVSLFISLAVGAGMVLVIARIPAGTYFNLVGLATAIGAGVVVKYGRK